MPTDDVEQLIRTQFLKESECLDVSNINVIGQVKSIGSFSNGTPTIPMDAGIVFSTGNLEDIPGPNIGVGTSGGRYGPSNAPYLQQIIRSGQIFDAVGVEFDFVPTNNVVGFSYIFASEEYCEYVGSEFNDIFGFFVSGPGINGNGYENSINIAKIPNENDVVSINTVNHEKNSAYFINNLTPADAIACGINDLPQSPQLLELDGFTRKLQAFINVIPCETYHIRLVVGDVADDAFDSAVFLEAKSFETGGLANVRATVVGSEENTVYENCLEGQFIFGRNKFSNREEAIELNYTLNATATNGVDYEMISGQAVIPANKFQEFLPIEVLPDDIEEGTEYIELVIETKTCDCIERDTAILFIEDSKEDINVSFDETFVCAGQPFTLSPTIEDAIEPLQFQWQILDSTGATFTDQIFQSKEYAVTVSDFCGATDNAVVEAQLQDIPELMLDGNFTWCAGRTPELLPINLQGQAPWSLHFSIDNQPSFTIDNITTNPFLFPLEQAGLYSFIGFDDRYCTGNVSGAVSVEGIPFDFAYQAFSPSCLNASDGRIELAINGGIPPFNIDWNIENEGEDESILNNLLSDTYNVTISDQQGCVLSDSIQVSSAAATTRCNIDIASNLYIPNAFSPNRDGVNDGFTIYPKYGLIQTTSYQIFDRWGNLVFQSETMDATTDFSYWSGANYENGVFTCLAKIQLTDGSLEYSGQDVTIVK